MSIDVDCPACQAGNHERHNAGWGTRPGLIGGTSCACDGTCAERYRADLEAFAERFPLPTAKPMTADHTVAEDGYQERDDCAEAVAAALTEGDAVRDRKFGNLRWMDGHQQGLKDGQADIAALRARFETLADEWERLAAGNEVARGGPTKVAGYYRRCAAQARAALGGTS